MNRGHSVFLYHHIFSSHQFLLMILYQINTPGITVLLPHFTLNWITGGRSKDKIETGFNLFEKVAGQDADTICQKMFVDGDNLRDICYRIVGKTGASLRQHDISRSLSQTEIPGDNDNDNR